MFFRTLVAACCAASLLAGCSDTRTKPNAGADNAAGRPDVADHAASSSTGPVASKETEGAVDQHNATNTGRNVRDRDRNAVTADSQSESPADVERSAEIRRAITQDSSLSVNAHNVKIIVREGTVTLRGPVDSEDEKAAIVAEARRIAGKSKVVDELEVEEQANQ